MPSVVALLRCCSSFSICTCDLVYPNDKQRAWRVQETMSLVNQLIFSAANRKIILGGFSECAKLFSSATYGGGLFRPLINAAYL